MDLFIRAAAAVLVAVIMYLVLERNNKEIALLLTVCMCCMIGAAIHRFTEPVIAFVDQLQDTGRINADQLEVLLKVVGISFITEITALVCSDAGNGTLGKMLQILSSCVILWLSIPLLSSLLALVQQILGEI